MGYAMGYVIDQPMGSSMGYAMGYAMGYVMGYAMGYAMGYVMGYVMVESMGYAMGYAIGYAMCYTMGYAGKGVVSNISRVISRQECIFCMSHVRCFGFLSVWKASYSGDGVAVVVASLKRAIKPERFDDANTAL